MSYKDAVYRIAKQNSHCRVCDKVNFKGKDMVVYFYSIRNRGQSILICPDCIRKLYDLVVVNEELK